MKLFGMCIDKRVVIGVVAAAGLVWWLAPGAFAAALPLLLFAICPLSMLVMMKAMNGMNGQQPDAVQPPPPPPSPTSGQRPGSVSGETTTGRALDDVSAALADVDARRD